MSTRNELVDLVFVLFEPWVDVLFVDDTRTLGLGEDEVEEEDETDIRIEGDPILN